MNLEQILELVIQRIRSGSLENEAQVKQAVIVPILRALDWDDADPAEFKPEYSVDNGRVDYALLGQTGPLVFIEAKGIGRVDISGEEQLFRYAVNKGVPFLVLTDGDMWGFYLSMAAGAPAERRFYRAELTREGRIPEYARFLRTHLHKSRVVSGDARRAAEDLLASNQDREKAREAIPGVWRSLLKRPDDMLRDLLMEQVADECGTMPEQDDVESFLKDCLSGEVPEAPDAPTPATKSRPRKSSPEPQPATFGGTRKITGYILENRTVETGTAYRTLAEVLKEFHQRDPNFMERFAAQTVGSKRRLVSQDRNALYPDRPDFVRKASLDLGNGWWFGHYIGAATIRNRIRTACEIAGVKYGSQLKLIES